MSLVRNGLLALTTLSPSYGLQLRNELTRRTGRTLNAAQVYTTLNRLERDGKVQITGQTTDGLELFLATDQGIQATREWLETPETTFEGTVFQMMLALTLPTFDTCALFEKSRLYWESQLEKAQVEPVLAKCDQDNEHTPARQKIANLLNCSQIATAQAAISWLTEADECCSKGYDINQERPARGRPLNKTC